MCRIASLFLLQRLKGSMSGDARDFNDMETIDAEYYSSVLVQLKDILEEKRRRKVPKGVLFLHDNAPAHRHLQPRRNWPTWASSVLITHPILRIWPRRTATCSLFRPTRRSFLSRRPGWTDNLLIFFLTGFQKLQQRAENCADLRGECVE